MEKVFTPYWNEQCAENASRLLSHVGIDWLVSASDDLSKKKAISVGKSWCAIKQVASPTSSSKSWLSSRFPLPETTDSVIRSRAILLKPSKAQQRILRGWAGSYRKAYNLTIELMCRMYEETGKTGSYMSCRKDWIVEIRQAMPWYKEIPAHTIYGAMQEAEKDYHNCIRKRAKGEVCNLPRCRARTQRSFFILGSCITSRGIYPRLLGSLRSTESLPNKPMDSRIVFTAGKWWLRVPEEVQTLVADNQGRVCSVDPGVRSFITVFSPELIAKVQEGGFSRIVRLALRLDDLISRKAKEKSKRRKARMQIAIEQARLRIRNLIDDLHYQTIGWLFRNFDTVIIPNSNFTSAVCKASRKIRSTTVRSLLSYAFCRFRDRVKHKAALFGKSVITVCESYTSKTHNITGEIKQIGGAKTITSRGIRIDRDLNGALGIFLKALLAQPLETAHCYQKVA